MAEAEGESLESWLTGVLGRNRATIAACVCGALFIGHCIYLDHKRQSDPSFKNRL